ncbi:MAG: hypothetical protein A3F18_07540 [Legionellales bacterium RIFCSPHIGHO2_12_FULL_37_14]|nr:MAG: hypothetical protein A3F18_07540 [Legionellales bacterium RIFCSPHIGHO2_12_FULL_37_14]
MKQILNLEKLKNAKVDATYFPYLTVEQFINDSELSNVIADFPKIKVRGSVPYQALNYGSYFKGLINELLDTNLRSIIAAKFNIDLANTSTMITVRGQTNLRDGAIHTDTPSKLMTLLFYFNQDWQETKGNLRLLKNGTNLDDYFAEITPTAGKLLIFKVTNNCWHGHYPFIGKRQAIQLNYVTNKAVVAREVKKHTFSYRVKKITNFLGIK